MAKETDNIHQEVLAGLVDRVTFHSEESGFCVLRVKARGHRDLITTVGHAAMISAGEWVTASGEWAASHNAYELMRWSYGVSQKQIMELAPVLFSIMAAHALKVPAQDDALEREARMSGRPSTQMIGDNIDRQASKLRWCFDLASPDPNNQPSRNLFDTAIHRLSLQATDYVDARWYVGAAPGDIPGATGYVPNTEFLEEITGGDWTLVEAIVKGRIRLSAVLQKIRGGKEGTSVQAFADAIRHAHNERIEEQRGAGLKKLKAWRAFYAARHPELAEEYDNLVTQHCHEEGSVPARDDVSVAWSHQLI